VPVDFLQVISVVSHNPTVWSLSLNTVHKLICPGPLMDLWLDV